MGIQIDWQTRMSAPPGKILIDWWIASVNRPAATRLIDWLREHRPGGSRRAVGLGRLAAGGAARTAGHGRHRPAGRRRGGQSAPRAGRPAVIVDVGTAITVDLVSADGAFLGGAILPGIQMSARALHEFTDLLPLVDVLGIGRAAAGLGQRHRAGHEVRAVLGSGRRNSAIDRTTM